MYSAYNMWSKCCLMKIEPLLLFFSLFSVVVKCGSDKPNTIDGGWIVKDRTRSSNWIVDKSENCKKLLLVVFGKYYFKFRGSMLPHSSPHKFCGHIDAPHGCGRYSLPHRRATCTYQIIIATCAYHAHNLSYGHTEEHMWIIGTRYMNLFVYNYKI